MTHTLLKNLLDAYNLSALGQASWSEKNRKATAETNRHVLEKKWVNYPFILNRADLPNCGVNTFLRLGADCGV